MPIDANENMAIGDSWTVELNPGEEGKRRAIRVATQYGTNVAYDKEPGGDGVTTVSGHAPQQEQGTHIAMAHFAVWLRSRVGVEVHAEFPVGPECGIDGHLVGGDARVPVQVTRPPLEWRDVAAGKALTLPKAPDELAALLKRGIEGKHLVAPPRPVLLIDAVVAVPLSQPSVVDRFLELHGPWASELGFPGIFVIGPSHDHGGRLDAAKVDCQWWDGMARSHASR